MKLFSGWRRNRTQQEAKAAAILPQPMKWKVCGDDEEEEEEEEEEEYIIGHRNIEIRGMLAIGTMGAIRYGEGASKTAGDVNRSGGAAAEAAVVHKYDINENCSRSVNSDEQAAAGYDQTMMMQKKKLNGYGNGGIHGQGSPLLEEMLASSLFICRAGAGKSCSGAGFRQAPPDFGGREAAADSGKKINKKLKKTSTANKKKNTCSHGLPPPGGERFMEVKGVFGKWAALLPCLARHYTTSPPATPGGFDLCRRHEHAAHGFLRRRVFLHYCYKMFHKFDSRKCRIENASSSHKNEETRENHPFDRMILQECRVSLHPHIIFDDDNFHGHNYNSNNTPTSLSSTTLESSIKENEALDIDDNYIDGDDLKAWLKYIASETTNANSSHDQQYHPYQQHQKHAEYQQEYDGDEVNYIHININDLNVQPNPLADRNTMSKYLISTNDEFVIIEL